MRKGQKHTEETIRKLRESHIGQKGNWAGKKRPPFSKEWLEKIMKNLKPGATKGMKFPNRKRTQRHSMETRNKISKAFIGKKHPLWRGGALYFWKKEALKRDNYTCQRCGINDKDVLQVDHIVPRSVNQNLAKDINNMVTLCANCHMKKSKGERRNKAYLL